MRSSEVVQNVKPIGPFGRRGEAKQFVGCPMRQEASYEGAAA